MNRYVRMAFLCRICKKELQAQHTGNWRNHHLSHSMHNSYSCQLCKKKFKSKQDIKKHYQVQHYEKRIVHQVNTCKVCMKHFTCKYDLKQHMLLAHTTADVSSADESWESPRSTSPKQANLNSNVTSELTTRTCEKISEIKVCEISTIGLEINRLLETVADTSSMTANLYAPSKRKYICGTCYQPLGSKSALNLHQKVCHPTEAITSQDTASMVVNSQKNVSVAQSLPSFQPLKSTLSTVASTPSTDSAVSKYHICGFCYNNFQTKSQLNAHILEEHSQRQHCESKKFLCKICKKGFKRKFDMNRHLASVHLLMVEDTKESSENEANSDIINSLRTTYSQSKRPASMCDIGPSKRRADDCELGYLEDCDKVARKRTDVGEAFVNATSFNSRDKLRIEESNYSMNVGNTSQLDEAVVVLVKEEEPDDYGDPILDEKPAKE